GALRMIYIRFLQSMNREIIGEWSEKKPEAVT
ncbi:unnamed protein product, partial [marine sediment metagenome]